jgi:transcriptional regulator with XRE-family HTH domain
MNVAIRSTHTGEKIKIARVSARMRIVDVAKKTGISVSTISRIERDLRKARWVDVVAICQVVGSSPNALACGSDVWAPGEVSL